MTCGWGNASLLRGLVAGLWSDAGLWGLIAWLSLALLAVVAVLIAGRRLLLKDRDHEGGWFHAVAHIQFLLFVLMVGINGILYGCFSGVCFASARVAEYVFVLGIARVALSLVLETLAVTVLVAVVGAVTKTPFRLDKWSLVGLVVVACDLTLHLTWTAVLIFMPFD